MSTFLVALLDIALSFFGCKARLLGLEAYLAGKTLAEDLRGNISLGPSCAFAFASPPTVPAAITNNIKKSCQICRITSPSYRSTARTQQLYLTARGMCCADYGLFQVQKVSCIG